MTVYVSSILKSMCTPYAYLLELLIYTRVPLTSGQHNQDSTIAQYKVKISIK